MGKYIYDAILTPEEEGGYSVDVPALPGCFTCGDDCRDAAFMAADAMKTWIEADKAHVVDGPVVSAAQAARELGVSAGRVTHMIDAGILDGYRSGRRTYVTEASIAARKAAPRDAGRPRREALEG